MKYRDVFHLTSSISKQNNVSCVLIGGFAVNYYKVTRQTADLDFLITKEDFKKVIAFFKKEGFKEDYSQEVFARFTAPGNYLMDIDFMFVDKDTLEKIIKEAKQVTIAGHKFMVPNLNHLIALKLHAIKYNLKIREFKDLSDIVELAKANKVNVKEGEFKDLCLKYGTEELYEKIVDRL